MSSRGLLLGSGGMAGRVVERHARIAKNWWVVYLGRLLEPFIFLFSVGIGVGALVEDVAGPGGAAIPYRQFVAPAMLVAGAMNTATFATAVDFYSKYKWIKTYDAMLATPIGVTDVMVGELLWTLLHVTVQSIAFVLTMAGLGLIESWWGLLLVPSALLVAFAFGAAGFVASTYLRSWLDFDFVFLAIIPFFLFSASFFPLSQYPEVLAWVVRLTPLYHGVDLARDLALGAVGWTSLVSVSYLTVMGAVSLVVANRRLNTMLQP